MNPKILQLLQQPILQPQHKNVMKSMQNLCQNSNIHQANWEHALIKLNNVLDLYPKLIKIQRRC